MVNNDKGPKPKPCINLMTKPINFKILGPEFCKSLNNFKPKVVLIHSKITHLSSLNFSISLN